MWRVQHSILFLLLYHLCYLCPLALSGIQYVSVVSPPITGTYFLAQTFVVYAFYYQNLLL